MTDITSLLLGLFIGLSGGCGLGAMATLLIFVFTRVDFSERATEDISTDEEEVPVFEQP